MAVWLQVAVLTGLAGLPWVVKPVYGFISDSIPLFGYRWGLQATSGFGVFDRVTGALKTAAEIAMAKTMTATCLCVPLGRLRLAGSAAACPWVLSSHV